MRGRTIYYRNRRILVFCGKKKNTPHSENDIYSTAAETATTGENTEARTTESSEFSEAESGNALGSDDETFITNTQRAEVENGISIPHKAKGTVNRQVLATVENGLSIPDDIKSLNTESALSKAESGASTHHTAQALKTVSRLSEAVENMATGNQGKTIKTEQHERAEAESGVSSQQEIKAKKTSALLSEAESGISTRQYNEPYVEQPTIDIPAGTYEPRNDIASYEAFYLDIPFSYIDDDEQLYYGNSIETKYEYIMQAWGWTMYFDGSLHAIAMGTYFWNCPTITVTQTTAATVEQFRIFNKYFRRVS